LLLKKRKGRRESGGLFVCLYLAVIARFMRATQFTFAGSLKMGHPDASRRVMTIEGS